MVVKDSAALNTADLSRLCTLGSEDVINHATVPTMTSRSERREQG